MKQLELDFKDESTNENYHSVTIDKGGNQIFKWYDTLSESREKISYHEYVYDTPNYLDLENWIDINKKGLGKYAFWWFKMYLKSMTRQKDRLEKLKRVLNDMEISFETGDWQTLDRDREDNEKKTNKKLIFIITSSQFTFNKVFYYFCIIF